MGPPPPAGLAAAICVDVVDLGLMENKFDPEAEPKPMVRLVWELSKNSQEGKPYLVRKDYTLSLHEKATLRKHLDSWRGQHFTESELRGFDVEKVCGVPCMLLISNKKGSQGDRMFANVDAVMHNDGTLPAAVASGNYIREKDRNPEPEGREMEPHAPTTDEDLPF